MESKITVSICFRDFINASKELKLGKHKFRIMENQEDVILRLMGDRGLMEYAGFKLMWDNKNVKND